MSNCKQNPLRKLASSHYWQILYNRCKEIGSLKLFVNETDLSNIQIVMLQWLEIYSTLYTDLSLGEDLISEAVIHDEIRTDAYLLYKRKKRNKKDIKEDNKETDRIIFIPKGKKR